MTKLVERVERLSTKHALEAPRAVREDLGQFFTPARVAEFMAALIGTSDRQVRVLDPGAGTGILGIAAARSLLARGASSVHLVTVENDQRVLPSLSSALAMAKDEWGQSFSYEMRVEDFLDYGQILRQPESFDVVISNPPYGKLSPKDPRGGGTTNTYTRFMEIGADLLAPGGSLCFIIPRSYATGLYFRRFRQRFHRSIALTRVHLFRSRRDAFRADQVLQESIIVAGQKSSGLDFVDVRSSDGVQDLGSRPALRIAHRRVLDLSTAEAWLHLPESESDLEALEIVESQAATLSRLRLAVSTGPVVPFRARSLSPGARQRGVPVALDATRHAARSHLAPRTELQAAVDLPGRPEKPAHPGGYHGAGTAVLSQRRSASTCVGSGEPHGSRLTARRHRESPECHPRRGR